MFSGNHNFIEGKPGFHPTSKNFECKDCLLTLNIYYDSFALFYKDQNISKAISLDELDNLPKCHEVQIKNLLE